MDMNKGNVLPEGNDLLNGLFQVQDYLNKINDRVTNVMNLEKDRIELQQSNLKKKITTEEITSDMGKLMQVFLVCLFFGYVFTSFVYPMVNPKTTWSGVFWGIVIGAVSIGIPLVLLQDKYKNKFKKTKIGFLIFDFLFEFALFFSYPNVLIWVVAILGHIVGLIVVYLYCNNYNSKVASENAKLTAQDEDHNQAARARNAKIDQQCAILSTEITAIKNEMQEKTASWYPVDYYSLDSVAHFISILKNHEAENIKEMVKVFKEDAYRDNVLNDQMVMKQQLDDSLAAQRENLQNQQLLAQRQQEMVQLQKKSNMIQMANAIASMVTARNTSQLKDSAKNIADNTKKIVDNTTWY